MAVLEKERVEEQRSVAAPTRAEAAPKQRRSATGWTLGILAVVTVAAVITAALIVAGGSESGEATKPASAAVQDLRTDQQILADLAARGYLPPEAVDEQRLATEKLVNQGQVPAESLEPGVEPPVFTESEVLTMHYVDMGQLPYEAVDWETIELKRLIVRGILPREVVD